MTDLPAWLQEIRDRADKATEGPWYVMEDDDDLCMCMVGVAKDPMNSYGNYGNTIAITLLQVPRVADVDDARWDENADFIAHARADVPRLIGLVGEMGEAIRDAAEVLQEHVEGESVLIERLWRLWKKYRWEAEDNG